MKFELNNILRENIKKLVPYSSAREEYKGKSGIFLDANENSFGSSISFLEELNLNRYPDTLQLNLKEKFSKINGLPTHNMFFGNGSDEAIDILFRAFCDPQKDNVIVCPPTYGMYEVSANINDVEVQKVPLIAETFQLDEASILKTINTNTKLIFICSPNNPTGNGAAWNSIKTILEKFNGIVVLDEAYVNFSKCESRINELRNYPNLVILQTLSKAWGLAGLRVGMAFASECIIDVFNKIKPPYNINSVSQNLALKALDNCEQVNEWVKMIITERERVADEMQKISIVLKVYPSEANFILVKVTDVNGIYKFLESKLIIVRNRNTVALCEGCLRFTIGTVTENNEALKILKEYKS